MYFKSKKGYEGHVANRHTPRLLGADGKLKSKKEMEGLNKVITQDTACKAIQNIFLLGFERDPGQERGGDGAEDH